MPDGTTKMSHSTAALLDQHPWHRTAVGDRALWSGTLRTLVDLLTHSVSPILILWGEDMIQIYNDTYSQIIGLMHPDAYGSKASENWKNYWHEFGPILQNVFYKGIPYQSQNRLITLYRNGYAERCYFSFSYSPIYEGPTIVGIFVQAAETTQIIADAQSLRRLRDKQLKNLFVQASVAMCILTGTDFVVEVANDRMLEIWERTLDSVFGKPISETLPEAKSLGYKELLTKVLDNGEKITVDEMPLTLTRNNKSENIFVKLTYQPLREEDGTISGVMVLADEVTEQVAARKRVEESDIRHRLAIEAAEIGTFDWDIINSSFQYSDRFAHIYGYKEIAGLSLRDFETRIYPDDQSIKLRADQEGFETGILHYEARIQWPEDNSIHWVRVDGKVLFDPMSKKPSRIYGTTLDVTDRKVEKQKLENLLSAQTAALKVRNNELKKSEERYHKMINEVQEYAIILLDENGIIQNWNKGAEKIKQYTEKEAVGRPFQIFYLPQDRASRLPEKLIDLARSTGRAVHEGWRLRKDQTRFWGSITITALHDDANNVIGFSKVTRDLTERKMAEDRLRKYAEDLNEYTQELKAKNDELKSSEERYHKMISEIQDYAIILLSINGDIENWNAGAQVIKGYLPDEIIGKSFRVFYTAKDQEHKLPERLLHEATVKGKASHEGWRVRKDGTKFWGSIVITALHDSTGKIIGFSKVTRDLTDKKEADDRQLDYARKLEARNRALEQFAYVASHDLQEPLRKIQTFSDLVQNNLSGPKAEGYVAKINSSAKRMSDLIKSVLNYSRLSDNGIEFTANDLNQIFLDVKTDFELLIQEKNAVIISAYLPTINGVTLQLNQLFSNLISNSLKFSISPPLIKISAKSVSRKEIIDKPEYITASRYTEISFSDNGIGFDAQYEKVIFTMFQRLHGSDKFAGTGIGLALCKKIMENHNGHITAKSEPGKGSTFYLYFPEDQ